MPRPSRAFLAGMAAGILGLAIVALHVFANDEDALFDGRGGKDSERLD